MSDEQVSAYFSRMQGESYLAYLDMVFLNLPRPRRLLRMLALGGTDDAISSPAEVQATARTYEAKLEVFPGMPHHIVLDERWQTAADRTITWLKSLPGICQPFYSDVYRYVLVPALPA